MGINGCFPSVVCIWLNPPVLNVEFQSHGDEDALCWTWLECWKGFVGTKEINVEKDLWGLGKSGRNKRNEERICLRVVIMHNMYVWNCQGVNIIRKITPPRNKTSS